MKIDAVETLRLPEHANLIWVRIHADGLTGLGETWFGAAAVEADIHDRIAPQILGRDASRIEGIAMALHPYTAFGGASAEMRANSAIDVALWDLAGKAAGRPLCDLLGGRVREAIRVYNTCAGPNYVSRTANVRPDNFGVADGRYEDLDAFMNAPADLAASLLEMGISSMKIWPFDFAVGAAEGYDISVADLKAAVAPFEKIRAAHGDRMRLKAELHGLWSLPAALRIARALEPLDMDWIEDPVFMDRTAEIADLVAATSAPIAGGETLASLGQFRALIEEGNVATPIMDVVWGGGVSAARKVAALAEARSRPIAFHDCSGPVTLAVSTHLALSLRNVREQEMTRGFYFGWYSDLVDAPPPLRDGMITVPDTPGLGLDLSVEVTARADLNRRITRA